VLARHTDLPSTSANEKNTDTDYLTDRLLLLQFRSVLQRLTGVNETDSLLYILILFSIAQCIIQMYKWKIISRQPSRLYQSSIFILLCSVFILLSSVFCLPSSLFDVCVGTKQSKVYS